MKFARLLPALLLAGCADPIDFPELVDRGFIGVAVPTPQVLPGIEFPFTLTSGMTIDHLGQLHAGLEAVFEERAISSANTATIMTEIPDGYTHLAFDTIVVSLRSPGPNIHSAALFVIWLAPNEIRWGQVIVAVIVRSLTEPQNIVIPGFTRNLYGARFIVVQFQEVSNFNSPANFSDLEMQMTGQFLEGSE